MMARGRPDSTWRRWRPGIIATGLLHGAALLALSITLYTPRPLAAPPSFAVEMMPAPPTAQPHPDRPQPQTRQTTPTTPVPPIAPLPPAPNGIALPPPASAHAAPDTPTVPTPPTPPPAAAAAVAPVARAATSSLDPKAKVSWQSDVLARLEAAKRYPPSARFGHEEATIKVQFAVDRSGRVISSRLVQPSGMRDLDDECLALLKRVRLPPPPATMLDEALTMTVPIEFAINPT